MLRAKYETVNILSGNITVCEMKNDKLVSRTTLIISLNNNILVVYKIAILE